MHKKASLACYAAIMQASVTNTQMHMFSYHFTLTSHDGLLGRQPTAPDNPTNGDQLGSNSYLAKGVGWAAKPEMFRPQSSRYSPVR